MGWTKHKEPTSSVWAQEDEEAPCPFWAPCWQVCHDLCGKERSHFCLLLRTTHRETLLQGPLQPPRSSLKRILTPHSFEDGHTPSATRLPLQRGSWICRMGGLTGCAPLSWGRAPASSAGESRVSLPWEVKVFSQPVLVRVESRFVVTSCCSLPLVF